VLPLLLAQLVAPPLQPGPVRLPAPSQRQGLPEVRPGGSIPLGRPGELIVPREAPRPTPNQEEVAPAQPPVGPPLPTTPRRSGPPTSAPAPESAPAPRLSGPKKPALPQLQGLTLYNAATLRAILAPCADIQDPAARLQACAAALSSRLYADGYTNTRVYTRQDPPAGLLEVVEGRIAEVRVEGPDGRLNRRLRNLLLPLQGTVLRLPELEARVARLERLSGVGGIQASLNRLGSDPTRAVLVITVDSGRRTLQGDLSLRNDGSPGSGQFRGLATLLQGDLVTSGDTLLLYGEANTDSQPDLGYSLASISYALPLGDRLQISGAFGASRRNLIEFNSPGPDLSFRQLQVLGQADYNLGETLNSRWFGFAGLSVNRTDGYLGARAFPLLLGAEADGWLRTGFLRFGLAAEGQGERINWSGSAYGLQGVAGLSTAEQLKNLGFYGIEPGRSRALGLQLSGVWRPARRWQLTLQAAAQQALNPLTGAMGIGLGSDNGLRGLPGQVISGDSGLLGETELSWSAWQQGQAEIQLVPFLGAGRVSSNLPEGVSSSDVGAGGVLVRWLQGQHWLLELGWVSQFGGSSANLLQGWLLNNGLYSRISYRF
jgi:hemolysin activation/secretion protein